MKPLLLCFSPTQTRNLLNCSHLIPHKKHLLWTNLSSLASPTALRFTNSESKFIHDSLSGHHAWSYRQWVSLAELLLRLVKVTILSQKGTSSLIRCWSEMSEITALSLAPSILRACGMREKRREGLGTRVDSY